ncbi:MAG TPA: DJ-1 family protein [Cyanobacteria bacterium UBA8156]|nr:DJ-1 family protein [Cyanobacteria bacterium UBA8156]
MTGAIAVVPLVPGFEEIEAVTIIDVLRRGGVSVVVAGLTAEPVAGSHDIALVPDQILGAIAWDEVSALVLPGGPGTATLQTTEPVIQALQKLHGAGKLTAAVCAAPLVLAAAGLLTGKRVTSYPTVRDRLGGIWVEEPVVQDGTILTGSGPATALPFALKVLAYLAGAEVAENVAQGMLYPI